LLGDTEQAMKVREILIIRPSFNANDIIEYMIRNHGLSRERTLYILSELISE